MQFFLEVIDSPDPLVQGAKVKLTKGMTIGRKSADFVILDPKLSSIHGLIDVEPDGRMILLDQESSNGITINAKKVKRVILFPNVHFSMGSTRFRVFESAEELVIEGLRQMHWTDRFKTGLTKYLKDRKSARVGVPVSTLSPDKYKIIGAYGHLTAPFRQSLQLTFLTGLQMDEVITLGYGPRRAGFMHFDISLREPGCAEEVFELRPKDLTAELLNFVGEDLKVNGERAQKVVLQDDDIIQFGNTQIRITFVNI